MKRDCGEGELIPIRTIILYNKGMSDREYKEIDPSKWDEILASLPAWSSIRLYVEDRQGYRNCIYSIHLDGDRQQSIGTDRRAEIIDISPSALGRRIMEKLL